MSDVEVLSASVCSLLPNAECSGEGEVVFVVDDGRIVDASGSLQEMLGKSREELVGESVAEMFSDRAELDDPAGLARPEGIEATLLLEARLHPIQLFGRDLEVLILGFISPLRVAQDRETMSPSDVLVPELRRVALEAKTVREICESALEAMFSLPTMPAGATGSFELAHDGDVQTVATRGGHREEADQRELRLPLLVDEDRIVGYLVLRVPTRESTLGVVVDDVTVLELMESTTAVLAAPIARLATTVPEADSGSRLSRVLGALESTRRKVDATNRTKQAFLTNMWDQLLAAMTGLLANAEQVGRSDGASKPRAAHLERIKKNGEILKAVVTDFMEVSQLDSGVLGLLDRVIETGRDDTTP